MRNNFCNCSREIMSDDSYIKKVISKKFFECKGLNKCLSLTLKYKNQCSSFEFK